MEEKFKRKGIIQATQPDYNKTKERFSNQIFYRSKLRRKQIFTKNRMKYITESVKPQVVFGKSTPANSSRSDLFEMIIGYLSTLKSLSDRLERLLNSNNGYFNAQGSSDSNLQNFVFSSPSQQNFKGFNKEELANQKEISDTTKDCVKYLTKIRQILSEQINTMSDQYEEKDLISTFLSNNGLEIIEPFLQFDYSTKLKVESMWILASVIQSSNLTVNYEELLPVLVKNFRDSSTVDVKYRNQYLVLIEHTCICLSFLFDKKPHLIS